MENINFQAEPLLDLVVNEVLNTYQERVISIFKIGSLGAHGGFSLCSDVDIAILLDEVYESDYQIIKTLWDRLKSADIAFAPVLSIFWSCYNAEVFSQGIGRFPPFDRLDFLQHGILLYGIDKRNELPAPSHKDMVLESAKFISSYIFSGDKFDKLANKPEAIFAEGARYFTKFILFPVRLLFTIEKPGVIGSNQDTVKIFNEKFSQCVPTATTELVNIAYKYRDFPANEPVTIPETLIGEGLIPLYIYCFEQYCNELEKFKEMDMLQTMRNGLIKLTTIRNLQNKQVNNLS